MVVIKCENGHHYDGEKYSTCPHCEKGLITIEKEKFVDDLREYKSEFAQDKSAVSDDIVDSTDFDPSDEDTIDLSGVTSNDEDTVELVDATPNSEETTQGGYTPETVDKPVVGWLVCTKGYERGKDYRLYHGWNRIGRGPDMNIRITDDKKILFNNQAAVVFEGKKGEFYIVNQERSLTYLNDVNVAEVRKLYTGDVITMGDTELIFVAFCTEERKW